MAKYQYFMDFFLNYCKYYFNYLFWGIDFPHGKLNKPHLLWILKHWLALQLLGGVPEWLKGTGCKPVGYAYVGSNPTPSTSCRAARWKDRRV